MKTLYRYELEFDRTIEYVKDNLNDVNALSRELLNIVDFKLGTFFTLLTLDSDLERLYEFESGIVLPQNPIIVEEIHGKKSRHQEIPTIKEELSDFIYKKLNNSKLSCVFDEVVYHPDDSLLNIFYEKKALFLYKNEVIYLISDVNKNREFLLKCMRSSFNFWHSIGVLTEADCFKNDNNILSLKDIKTICRKTKMILVSAYDGEAYILWEKIKEVENDFS